MENRLQMVGGCTVMDKLFLLNYKYYNSENKRIKQTVKYNKQDNCWIQ
jgi:hypothetical protein